MKNNYSFTLRGINVLSIEQKYGLRNVFSKNVTKLEDLNIDKDTKPTITFSDDSKRIKKCSVSIIKFKSNKMYCCFWDRHPISPAIEPIGCPIRYISNKLTKSYESQISKERYTITENVSKQKLKNTKGADTLENNYFETDGIFCSFNCCLAFIQSPENSHNPFYSSSEQLLNYMYKEMTNIDPEIVPAPHWRVLENYGGNLTIDEFRNSFNKVQYISHGRCAPIGTIFEDKIKF